MVAKNHGQRYRHLQPESPHSSKGLLVQSISASTSSDPIFTKLQLFTLDFHGNGTSLCLAPIPREVVRSTSRNPFWSLLYLAKGFKLVKEMLLQELIDLVVVVKLSTTLLKMLNPVETCVPDLWRKTLLYPIALYVSHKYTVSLLSANILLERV